MTLKAVPGCPTRKTNTCQLEVVHLLAMTFCVAGFSAEPRYFPADDGIRGRITEWYARHLTAMREPSLYEERAKEGVEFRFLHLPTFHRPSAFRIIRTATGADLRVVRLSGMGGYSPEKIESETTHKLNANEWKQFFSLIEKAGFWEKAHKPEEPLGFDGSRWVLEGRSEGRYQMIDAWSPNNRTAERKLEAFVACCDFLWEKAGLQRNAKEYY